MFAFVGNFSGIFVNWKSKKLVVHETSVLDPNQMFVEGSEML